MNKGSLYYTYILQNPDGRFYIGHTDNLELRLASHNETGVSFGKYTRKNGPWKLVWSEPYSTRSEAMQREQEIKSWKSAKYIHEKLLKSESSVVESRQGRD